jgi:23S rRNA maturation mini-RNase III
MAFFEDARDSELIRLLGHLLHEMNTKSAHLHASALRQDIKEAQALIGKLQCRELDAEIDLWSARN